MAHVTDTAIVHRAAPITADQVLEHVHPRWSPA